MSMVDIGGVFFVGLCQVSMDIPVETSRYGLLAFSATLEGMLADLRQQREADGVQQVRVF